MVRDCRAVSGCVLRRRLFSWPLFSAEQKLDHHMRCSAAAITARVIAIATRYFTITLGKQVRVEWLLDLSACHVCGCTVVGSLSYYAALLGGRVKCCTPSVCPSVPCLRFTRNRRATETSNLDPSNWERKFEVSRSKNKVTGNENVNIVFRASSWKKWTDLRQTDTKMIGRFYVLDYISPAKMRHFVTFVCFSVTYLT